MQVQYKLFLGDFNLPHIRWSNYTSETRPADFDIVFVEKVQDCFLAQHIHDLTRIRGDNAGSTLDLLFSNDESIVDEVKVDSPLGRSDHACLIISVDIQELEHNSTRHIYMYEKADYQQMKRRLDVDWTQYLPQDLNTEQKWRKFISKLQEVVEECIPKVQVNAREIRKRNVNLLINRMLWAKINRKQRLWERLKTARKVNGTCGIDKRIENEYRRLNNQVRRLTRNAVKI